MLVSPIELHNLTVWPSTWVFLMLVKAFAAFVAFAVFAVFVAFEVFAVFAAFAFAVIFVQICAGVFVKSLARLAKFAKKFAKRVAKEFV